MTDTLKKILLAGLGGAALSIEKSKDFFDEMVEKGHLTVEQGKILNEELKHSVKEAGNRAEEKEKDTEEKSLEEMLKALPKEERMKLAERLLAFEKEEE